MSKSKAVTKSFSPERPIFLHASATCSDLPSYIRTTAPLEGRSSVQCACVLFFSPIILAVGFSLTIYYKCFFLSNLCTPVPAVPGDRKLTTDSGHTDIFYPNVLSTPLSHHFPITRQTVHKTAIEIEKGVEFYNDKLINIQTHKQTDNQIARKEGKEQRKKEGKKVPLIQEDDNEYKSTIFGTKCFCNIKFSDGNPNVTNNSLR